MVVFPVQSLARELDDYFKFMISMNAYWLILKQIFLDFLNKI